MRRAVALLGLISAVSLFLYAFFLLGAVAHTAQRTHAQREIKAITSTLSSLEEQYLSSTKQMTLERARTLGYVTPSEVSTVYAVDPARALSTTLR